MKNIISVFGTRPEAIKMAPVVNLMKEDPSVKLTVCVTGQHRQMLDQVLEIFNIVPDYDLNIMKADQTLSSITVDVIRDLEPILASEKPDLMMVHGDTTTTMSASLAAYYAGVPIAHVEAGLRTGDLQSPFPEEANRSLVAKLARFHFAPTEQAKINLVSEGVDDKHIWVTGNTVIDSLNYILSYKKNQAGISAGLPGYIESFFSCSSEKKILVTNHRRENFGASMESVFEAIRTLARHYQDVKILFPVHLNSNVRKPAMDILKGLDNVLLIEPMRYDDFVLLINHVDLIITDSGGIQEEATSLGKNIILTRNSTERSEAVECGAVSMTGPDMQKILAEADRLLSSPSSQGERGKKLYGDGRASYRIMEAITEQLFFTPVEQAVGQ